MELADKYFKVATKSKLNQMLSIAIVNDNKGNLSRDARTKNNQMGGEVMQREREKPIHTFLSIRIVSAKSCEPHCFPRKAFKVPRSLLLRLPSVNLT